MRIAIFVSVVLLMILKTAPILAAQSGSMPTNGLISSTPGYGCFKCECPTKDEIAESVIERLDSSKTSEMTNVPIEYLKQFNNLDSTEKMHQIIQFVNATEEIQITNFSEIAEKGIEAIQKTNDLLDKPISEYAPQGSISEKALELLRFIGIDMTVLSLRDVPQIISCGIVSAGGLWNYFATLHECVSSIIDTKLAKEEPARFGQEEQKQDTHSAYETTIAISSELQSGRSAIIFAGGE